MLVLSRKAGEKIDVGDDAQIEVLQIRGNTVRLGLRAPDSVRLVRSELKDRDEPTIREAAPADQQARRMRRRPDNLPAA